MKSLSIGRAWALATFLLFIDLLVIMAMLHTPGDIPVTDQSQWDFRIAELRQLESQLAPLAAVTSAQQPNWLAIYFPQAGSIPPSAQQWRAWVGGPHAQASAVDQSGRVL